MTSELKEAFLNSWFGAPEGYHWSHGMSNKVEEEISNSFDNAIAAHTRAAPDVPELVPVGNGIFADGTGAIAKGEMIGFVGLGLEYKLDDDLRERHPVVRYDQAAAMLAAKDASYNKLDAAWLNAEGKITELEAKLAQLKAQKPYGYIDGPHFSTEPIEGWIPLYAAPTDAEQFQRAMLEELDSKIDAEFKVVELKAEIERLRSIALSLCSHMEMVNGDLFDRDNPHQNPNISSMRLAIDEARTALSGKSPS